MSRWTIAGIALLVAVSGCGSSGGEVDSRGAFCAGGKVRVSYSGPLSGPAADFGEQQVRGIELGIDKINKGGGIVAGALKGCKVELQGPYDDESSTATGVQIASKLARDKELLAYMGNVNSPVVLAAEPVVARAGLPMLVSYASAPEITAQGNKNVFRSILNGNQYGSEIANILVKQFGRKRIAAAYVNDAYGQPQIEALSKQVPELGGEVILKYSYQSGQNDFSAFVSKAKAAGADGVAILGNYSEAGLITSQLATSGLKSSASFTIVGAAGSNSPQFVKVAGDAANGVYFASNWNPGATSTESEEFVRVYSARYGEAPSEPAATGYDSLMMFAKAVADGGVDRKSLIAKLHEIEFSGVTGVLQFNEDGQAEGLRLSLLQVQGGKILPASVPTK